MRNKADSLTPPGLPKSHASVHICLQRTPREGAKRTNLKHSRAIVAITLVAAVLVFAAYTILSTPGSVSGPVPSKFSLNGKSFSFTYVATDQAARQQGLMNRKVTNTTTMLFAFPSAGTYRFWMYNTNTSLDMIWINASGETGSVVFVVPGAQPCFVLPCPDYGPSSPANYVIEAKAGFVVANGIQTGTAVHFS